MCGGCQVKGRAVQLEGTAQVRGEGEREEDGGSMPGGAVKGSARWGPRDAVPESVGSAPCLPGFPGS